MIFNLKRQSVRNTNPVLQTPSSPSTNAIRTGRASSTGRIVGTGHLLRTISYDCIFPQGGPT